MSFDTNPLNNDLIGLKDSSAIARSIRNFEPRVNLLSVIVRPNFDFNEMNVTIEYEIIGIDIPPQQLDFVLLPTR